MLPTFWLSKSICQFLLGNFTFCWHFVDDCASLLHYLPTFLPLSWTSSLSLALSLPHTLLSLIKSNSELLLLKLLPFLLLFPLHVQSCQRHVSTWRAANRKGCEKNEATTTAKGTVKAAELFPSFVFYFFLWAFRRIIWFSSLFSLEVLPCTYCPTSDPPLPLAILISGAMFCI